jgi:phosphate acetyltransferase
VVGGTRTGAIPAERELDAAALRREVPLLQGGLALIGAIPWQPQFAAPRVLDVARHLGARTLHEGEMATRRVIDVSMVGRTLRNMTHRLRPDALIVTPGDREDVLVAACMAALNGVPLAGVVLTGGIDPAPAVLELCRKAFETGLPVLTVDTDSYVTSARAAAINLEVAIDDLDRMERVMDAVAGELDTALPARAGRHRPRAAPVAGGVHAPARRARPRRRKRIVLPEGEEPRTDPRRRRVPGARHRPLRAARRRDEIERVAATQGVVLPEGLEVLEPTKHRRERYVAPMVELRRTRASTPRSPASSCATTSCSAR